MTKLIIYIDSEQNASAYRIEEDNSYSISFNGNEYESDLPTFAETVMEELRATPLSKMESRGGISVLLVSNGAANETIRKIMELLFHDDNEDGMLNVNIQELNVIEAKYFLPLIGNPEVPSAKDFANIYSIETSSFVQQKELDDLKSTNSRLINEIKDYKEKIDKMNLELEELREFRKTIIEKEDNIRVTQDKEKEFSKSIYKIDFKLDAEHLDKLVIIPKDKSVTVHKHFNNGDMVTQGNVIASYKNNHMYEWLHIEARKSGKIFYMVNNNSSVNDGNVIAVIGEESWTKDDAIQFLKQGQNLAVVKREENDPVIIKADVIKNCVSKDNIITEEFSYHPLLSSYEGDFVDGALVSKNQIIMKIDALFGKQEFEVKSPCDGKLYFLVVIKPDVMVNTAITAEKSLAMIVPESWSKSKAVEWYRSIEPLEEQFELSIGSIDYCVENLFSQGAYVLPNDEYVDFTYFNGEKHNKYSKQYCCVAGRIKYLKNNGKKKPYSFSGGKIAKIF